MYFDVHRNKWYKCLSRMRCWDIPIVKVESEPEARKEMCGGSCDDEGDQCFEPNPITDQEPFCVNKRAVSLIAPDERVFVHMKSMAKLADGFKPASVEM